MSTSSNDACEKSTKKTISPEHVLEALKVRQPCNVALARHADRPQVLDFESFIPEVEESNADFKQSQKVSRVLTRPPKY